MNENIEGSQELDAYEQLARALDEEDKIIAGMRAILRRTQDRAEAERIILGELASKMDLAMNHTRDAVRRWLADVRGEVQR